MGSPVQCPFVYTTSGGGGECASSTGIAHCSSSSVRIVRGDIVRAIPLSALGMESDYEIGDDGKEEENDDDDDGEEAIVGYGWH